MQSDDAIEATDRPHDPGPPPGFFPQDEGLPVPFEEDEEEILTIGHDMLHRERVDLEAGMSPLPPLTIGLILACTVLYVRQVQVGGLDGLPQVLATGAMQRDAVLDGETWRLISGGFLHASVDHLIGNMVMLFILGMACEHAFGRRSFLFLYTACCIAGSLFTMTGAVPTVGASGAIFGLGGAVIGLAYAHRDAIDLRDRRVGIVLAIWAAYTLGLGMLTPMVSNSCHLGGLLAGLVLGATLPPAILGDRREHARSLSTRTQALTAVVALAWTATLFLPRLW